VSPILGIWASQNYSRYSLPTSYDSIATTTVGSGGAATVTFSSIPSTYTHLQIRYIGRGALNNAILLRLNSDTGNNYAAHQLSGDGSSVTATSATSNNCINTLRYPGLATATSTFSTGIIDILDYTNTNKYTTTRHLGGQDSNGSGGITLESGVWMNTAAVTTIDLVANSTTFQQYSSFALFGIKGA
jgi:hypothetical protein